MTVRRALTAMATGLLLTLCAVSCGQSDQKPVAGYLYFGAGKYLGRLDLRTGDSTPVTTFSDLEIQWLSALDSGVLLLSVVATSREAAQSRALLVDPESLRSSEFLVGSAAQYLPEAAGVLYHDGRRLIIAPLASSRSSSRVLPANGANVPAPALSIGGNGVLFYADPSRQRIQRYDLDDGSTETLQRLSGQCVLEDAVWAESRQQLLCRAATTGTDVRHYHWVSPEGEPGETLPLPSDRHFRALAYLADQEVVILNETRQSWLIGRPRHPVWALDLRDGSLHRIARNQYLGRSVVYSRGW